MNLPVTSRQLTPVEQFTVEVLGDKVQSSALFRALPAHIRPEHFERNLINALLQNPKLMRHDPRLIYREVSKAAALGLLLDPQLGEAYIIESWGRNGPEPQLRTGYRGIMKLARQTKEIASIYPGKVCENDHFAEVGGTDRRLEHQINRRAPRGEAYCYYAVVAYKDGVTDFDVMDLGELHDIRDRSDGWKAFRAGKIKSSPWATDEGEMCKKTVLRRLMKRVPQSPDLSDALAMENAADFAPSAPRLSPQQPVHHLRAVEQPVTIDARPTALAGDDDAGDPYIHEPAADPLTERVAKRLDHYRGKVLARIAELNIDARRIEAAIGRTVELWQAADVARIITELQSIQEGETSADDIYPELPSAGGSTPAPAAAPEASANPRGEASGAKPAEQPADPADEAYAAGRAAADAGVTYEDMPNQYHRYLKSRKAWQDGYSARIAELEGEMSPA
jgi:phage RecT family recombinase